MTLEVIWEHMLETFGRFRDVMLEMSWLCLRAAWSILVLSLRKKTLHAKRFLKEQRPSPNRVCIYSYRSSLKVLGGISNVGQQEGKNTQSSHTPGDPYGVGGYIYIYMYTDIQ